MTFEWKEAYSVGCAEIDAQHKALFQIVGELHAAMLGGNAKQMLGDILARLIAYTTRHFATEERLMQASGYPDYAAHKALHDKLKQQVLNFQKEFTAGRAAITVQILQFLMDWLQHHIVGTDKKLGIYLRAKAAA
ncbi:MAG: bacteriohemerythrin [Bryobacteraceae bacterium]